MTWELGSVLLRCRLGRVEDEKSFWKDPWYPCYLQDILAVDLPLKMVRVYLASTHGCGILTGLRLLQGG